MIPIKAMYRKLPILVKSVLVVYPVTAITPKVIAEMKKVLAIDEEVYTEKIVLKLIPVNVEYIKKMPKSVLTLNFWNPAPINSTSPRGESVAIQPTVVRLPVTLLTIIELIISVANHTADNPDIIRAVNIREKTLETKLLERSFDAILADFDVVIFMLLFF